MIKEIVSSHAAAGILVDSNVLLLLFVGRFAPTRISTFKRTDAYTIADYEFLEQFLALFSRTITTPWVLAEVSNLAGQWGEPERTELMRTIRNGLTLLDERFIPSAEAAAVEFFPAIGLTDASFFRIARQNLLVLTDDRRLVGQLQANDIAAVNFTSIRPIGFS